MSANTHTVPALADRLTTLAEAYKEDVAAVMEDADKAEVDKSAVRRLSSWQRKDPVKRAEQEAIDHQYRFLAGEIDEPAEMPEDGELAAASALYADGRKVREVADVLKISVGKAQKLKTLAEAFGVHRKMNVNKMNAVEMTIADLGIPISVPEMTAEDLGDPLWVIDKDRAKFKEKVRAIASSVKVQRVAEPAPPAPVEDKLEIPSFLRRERIDAQETT